MDFFSCNGQKAAQKEDLLDDLYDLDDRLDRFIAQPLHEIWRLSLKDRSEYLSPSSESESSRTLEKLSIFLQKNEAYLSKKKRDTQTVDKFQSQLSKIFDGKGAARLDFGRLGSYIKSLEEENEFLRRKIEKHIERTSINDEPDAKTKMPVKSNVTDNDTSEGHGAHLEISREREIESMQFRSVERQAAAKGKQAVVDVPNRGRVGLDLVPLEVENVTNTGMQTDVKFARRDIKGTDSKRSAVLRTDGKELQHGDTSYNSNASCHSREGDNKLHDNVHTRLFKESKLLEEKMKNEMAELEKTHAKLKTKIAELTKEKTSLEARIEFYRKEITITLEKITNCDPKVPVDQSTRQDIDNIEHNLSSGVSKLLREIESLKEQALKDKEKQSIQLADLAKQNADLTETVTSATKGRNSLQLKLDEKNTKQKEKNLKAQTELESHLKTIKEQDESITALHKKLQETNNKYEQLNEKLQAMEETHKLAKLEIETQNQNIYSIQRKFESEHGISNSLEHELEREREKRSSLEKRISEQISAIEVLKSEKDKRINSLQDQLAEREKYAENYRQKAQSEQETNAIISKKNKQLSMKVIDLETRIETLEGQNSTQEAMYYKLEQSKAELQLQVEKLEQNSNALQGDLTRSNQDNLSLKNNKQRLSERVLNLEKENKATLLKRKTLEENQKLMQADVTNLQKRNVDLEKQISKLQEETKKQCEAHILLLEQKKALSEKTDSLQSELSEQEALFLATQADLEKEQKRSTVLMGKLADENQKLKELEKEFALIKEELDRLKSAKVMQVQLYHQSRIGLIKEIENELKAILKSEIEDETTELSFIECNEAADIDLNAPLLVTCINVSRIGTDAAKAIKALRLTSKMALVVIHHKDEHALPHQASERVLTGPAFANVGGIYDLAFLSNKGVYTCEMNRQTVKSLVYFLNKEGVKSVKDV